MPLDISVSAVLLDMDGTLVDSTAVVERVWSEWALAHALDPAEVLRVIHGRQGQESMALLLPERPAEENLADNRLVLERETSDVAGIVEIAGAADLLRALRTTPHALVTSATVALAEARMGAAGLEIPAVAVTAADVSASKPDPEGFLSAAASLGVEPAECLVFEDSAAGIEAGRRAGMRVVGVGEEARGRGADWVVPDLRGIRVTSSGAGAIVTLPQE